MSGAVTLRGIRVRVVPDDPIEPPDCRKCELHGNCPSAAEERAAGTSPCYHDEGHYYIQEEEDAQA